MTVLARFVFPASAIALDEALHRLPDARFALEKSVAKDDNRTAGLWITAANKGAVEDALKADSSVESFEKVADGEDGRWLFDVTFGADIDLFRSIVLSHGGVVLDAEAAGREWTITCRFPDRDRLRGAEDLLDDWQFDHDVGSVHSVTDATIEGADLTEDQRQALQAAFRAGYFEVPRDVTLGDVADELDISHQALSERLRRAEAELLNSMFHGLGDPDELSSETPVAGEE